MKKKAIYPSSSPFSRPWSCSTTSKHERYIRTGGSGEAFQQEILDLLLDAAARHEAAA